MESTLQRTLDAWSLLAVESSLWLSRLYARLGDSKQRFRALQAGKPAQARLVELGSTPDPTVGEAPRDEAAREEACWLTLFEAEAGHVACMALVNWSGQGQGLGAQRTTSRRALQQILAGYRTAFPNTMTEVALEQRSRLVARRCANTLLESLQDAGQPQDPEAALQSLEASILHWIREAMG